MTSRRSRMGFADTTRLMQKAADGDFEAFARLYDGFAPILMQLFIKRGADLTLAEDLTQKVFVCLWERRKSFRAESSFETYLFSIAKHNLNKEIRLFNQMAGRNLRDASESNAGSHTGFSQPEAELYIKELTEALDEVKAKLTNGQKKVLDLSLAGDILLPKTLEELGCSYKAYKGRIQRARKRLKELLAPFLEEER